MTLLIDGNRFAPLPCQHHYLLPPTPLPPGDTFIGTCKRCGETKIYPRVPEWDKKTVSLFDERKAYGPTAVYPIREAWDI